MAAEKPVVERPDGPAPTSLQVTDLTVGDGPEAAPGQTVTVHYVGVSFDSGNEFDASWNRGEPFRFPLGGGRVIAGWDQGVAGMKVGGRRQLVIPPQLAYGERGAGGVIKPGETLVSAWVAPSGVTEVVVTPASASCASRSATKPFGPISEMARSRLSGTAAAASSLRPSR
jgi:peptidylprolyl isomerase